MPTKDQHVTKAEQNAGFALSLTLTSPAEIDWALVALFYAALHYVEAYLAVALGQHITSHQTRDSVIGRETNLKKIYKAYGHLKYYGFTARYDVNPFTADDVQKSATKYFTDIKTSLTPHLK